MSTQPVPAPVSPALSTVSVAEAKANLSSIISTVQTKHTPFVILRRGVPVAQIIPIAERASGYGAMRGTVKELGDVVSPSHEEWTTGDE